MSMSILDTFLCLFNCAGEEFNATTDDYEDISDVAVAPSGNGALEHANPIGSSSISSPTSIYSIPSRESMNEVRQDSLHRFGRSPLLSFTTSSPMRFSFEGEDYGGELDKRDDSIRSNSVRTEHRQLDFVKRVNSITTVTTADSASLAEDRGLHQDSTESTMEYQIDVVAVRE